MQKKKNLKGHICSLCAADNVLQSSLPIKQNCHREAGEDWAFLWAGVTLLQWLHTINLLGFLNAFYQISAYWLKNVFLVSVKLLNIKEKIKFSNLKAVTSVYKKQLLKPITVLAVLVWNSLKICH